MAIDMLVHKTWREFIDVDLPQPKPITEETRQNTMDYANKVGCRGDVRTAMGLIYTDEEYKIQRAEELSRPLP